MNNKRTHWLKNEDKKYLGSWDLPEKDDLILTIKTANWEIVIDPKTNKKESKRVIRWEEKNYKPMIVNEVNSLSIISSTGIKYMEDSGGCKIKLYTIEGTWFGITRDAIRVRPTKVVVKKPILTPESSKWNAAKKSDMSIEDIRKYFIISDSDFKILRNKNKN